MSDNKLFKRIRNFRADLRNNNNTKQKFHSYTKQNNK